MIKRLKYLVILFMLLLTSCSTDNVPVLTETAEVSFSSVVADIAGEPVNMDLLDISGVTFTKLEDYSTAEYALPEFIYEFKSFISNQDYSIAEADYSNSYEIRMLDYDKKPLLGLLISEKSITFDRNVEIQGRLFDKDTAYETGEWINEYLNQYFQGNVLNPVRISKASKLKIPLEYYQTSMIRNGDYTINKYETITALHDFISRSFTGKELEITGCRRIYNNQDTLPEEANAGNAISVTLDYAAGDQYLYINSEENGTKLIKGETILLYKASEKEETYFLLGQGEIIEIKVDEDFDKSFQALFDKDIASPFKLGASEAEELLSLKKPYFLEYLCRNLGMEMWNQRGEDTFKKDNIKLESGKKYITLNLVNSFNSRLMLFDSKTGNYLDYIDFGGRQAGTEIEIQRAGPYTWITGNRCRGYGTGEALYYREWYTLDDNGVGLALSIPYNVYSVGPYGGIIVKAKDISLINKDSVRMTVPYSITRVYILDIAQADEYGQVFVKAEKKQEFIYDGLQGKFISSQPVDESGATQISWQDTDISEKCGFILKKEYDRLYEGIKTLGRRDDTLKWLHSSNSYKAFLEDCPESAERKALLELLGTKTGRDENGGK